MVVHEADIGQGRGGIGVRRGFRVGGRGASGSRGHVAGGGDVMVCLSFTETKPSPDIGE